MGFAYSKSSDQTAQMYRLFLVLAIDIPCLFGCKMFFLTDNVNQSCTFLHVIVIDFLFKILQKIQIHFK